MHSYRESVSFLFHLNFMESIQPTQPIKVYASLPTRTVNVFTSLLPITQCLLGGQLNNFGNTSLETATDVMEMDGQI